MVISKYQRPYGLVAEVSIKGDLPERYLATVEVNVPGVQVYWEILTDEEEVVANGFEFSEHRACLAVYLAVMSLWASGLLPVTKARQGYGRSVARVPDSYGALVCSSPEWAGVFSSIREGEITRRVVSLCDPRSGLPGRERPE